MSAAIQADDVRQQERAVEVRQHVAQILASATFASSPRLRQFLEFIVETTLNGKYGELKEYVIATSVYGRDVTYDPQIDSTVRVEASRLRRRLQDYYEREGRDSAVEILLPKGRYVPVFRSRIAAAKCCPDAQDTPATALVEPDLAIDTAVPAAPPQRSLAWLALFTAILLGGALWKFVPHAEAGTVKRPDSPPVAADVLARYLRAQRLLRAPVFEGGWPGKVPPAVTESIRAFEEVTAADPGFARAWVGLAEAEEWAYELDGNQPAARLDRAMAALERAVSLEPGLADAWSRLSSIYFHRYDNRSRAEEAARKAVSLNPQDLAATVRLIDLLRIGGRGQEAADVLQHALMLDPAAPKLWVQRALLAYDSGRYEEALAFADHALGLFTGKSHPVGWWIKGLCYERLGRVAEAEANYRAGMRASNVELWNAPSLGYLLARTGRTKDAEAILEALKRSSKQGRTLYYQIALVLTGLGRTGEAVASLEQGRAAGDTSIAFSGLEKRFDRLHDYPRFRALLSPTPAGI